MATHGIS